MQINKTGKRHIFNEIFKLTAVLSVIFLITGCEKSSGTGDSSTPTTDSSDTSLDSSDTADTNSDKSKDSSSSADDSDSDSDTYPKFDDPNVDDDKDGYTNIEGDCHDREPYINPDAIEDLGPDGTGDGMDNDCDGIIDEVELCDTELEKGVTPDYLNDDSDDGKSPASLAAAINLCDPRYYLGGEKIHSNTVNYDVAYATLDKIGVFDCFTARQGHYFAAIATGNVLQADANQAEYIDGNVMDATDPQPDFQGGIEVTTPPGSACDVTQFKVHLKAPSNALGFSFDFLFASSEYPEYLDQGWNDTFYAILEYKSVNSGKTTNISFDSNGNEIEVDANFFENKDFVCDERATGWDPGTPKGAGSTGWLRTTWGVQNPGDEFYLTFSIHDEGDAGVGCGWDSITLLDNFRWLTHAVEITPGTTIIGID
ncbi:MAG: putative metal-binding motif-containing protein [Deltaproteobacteria bacterium]|nr:putative metal-binding motif-containing protein [Deltaproteobacteria bacterium]